MSNGELEIYPAPLSFREPVQSPDLDSEPRTRTYDQETDPLRSLNDKFKEELKTLPKSARSNNTSLQKLVHDQDRRVYDIRLEDLQKLTSGFNVDKNEIEQLKVENKNYVNELERLKNELYSRELKWKEDNDFLIATVHTTLSKDMRTDKERENLVKLFVSKQTEKNEALIREQNRVIEHLRLKCSKYENEIKSLTQNQSDSALKNEVNELNSEVSLIRNLVYRLNVELSNYQANFPSSSLQSSIRKIDISSLPSRGPIPIWLVHTFYI